MDNSLYSLVKQSPIKSIQRGTVSATTVGVNVTISKVNTDKTGVDTRVCMDGVVIHPVM